MHVIDHDRMKNFLITKAAPIKVINQLISTVINQSKIIMIGHKILLIASIETKNQLMNDKEADVIHSRKVIERTFQTNMQVKIT